MNKRCKEKSGGCVPLFIGEYPGCSKEEYELERKEHLESLERAKNDDLDIEMNDCCLTLRREVPFLGGRSPTGGDESCQLHYCKFNRTYNLFKTFGI